MKSGAIGYILSLGIVSLAFLQCKLEKRLYTNGFHITSRKHPVSRINSQNMRAHVLVPVNHHENPPPSTIWTMQANKQFPDDDQVIMSIWADLSEAHVSPMILPAPPDSCSDLITLVNGDEVKVKIVEIGPTYIKYKRCDYLTGPTITTAKTNIFRVKQENGMIRVFERSQDPEQPVAVVPVSLLQTKDSGWAIASFIAGILAWLIVPAPLALIFGLVGLSQIKKSPQKFKGRWMAIVGTILGGIVTGFVLFLIVLNT